MVQGELESAINFVLVLVLKFEMISLNVLFMTFGILSCHMTMNLWQRGQRVPPIAQDGCHVRAL